jgi:DNA-directed RNA polymerase sigma subunit (sigma70/sigma32)
MGALDLDERDKQICVRRDAVCSFMEIAREFKVSRERDRRIASWRDYQKRRYNRLAALREAFAKHVVIKKTDY